MVRVSAPKAPVARAGRAPTLNVRVEMFETLPAESQTSASSLGDPRDVPRGIGIRRGQPHCDVERHDCAWYIRRVFGENEKLATKL